jgi:hypothetical protein
VNIDVLPDGVFQLFDAAEDTTNALVSDLGKPAFDQIQPGTVSGREMDMETVPFGQPVPDDGCLVRSLIIHHHVDIEPRGYVGLDGIEKFPEFLRTVTPMQLPDDTTGLQFQYSEQGGSAMAFIVVRMPFGLAGRNGSIG